MYIPLETNDLEHQWCHIYPICHVGGHFNWMVLDPISLLPWLASVVSLTQLGRGNLSQGIASRCLVCGHGCGTFYIIIINLYRRVSAYCESAIQEQVGLACMRKEVEQVRRNNPVSSIPSASASSFSPEFLPFSLMMDYIPWKSNKHQPLSIASDFDGRLSIDNVIFMGVVNFFVFVESSLVVLWHGLELLMNLLNLHLIATWTKNSLEWLPSTSSKCC